jgi:hypothetical protein
MLRNFFTFSRLTLFVALCISAIAAYYSVLGLSTIFAGAVIPIIVMGTILEIAKIVTTVWLHHFWDRAGYAIRSYLTGAVIALAFLTSMGIFGLLSKAHSDQGLVSGDVQAQLSLIDEKIKTQRDNIDVARRALEQLNAQVDQRLARGDTEAGAERAVQIRRQQAPERARLQREIGEAQKVIAQLNEERAPIAAKNRKVEAEVGPIKYIAALIYGDNPDTNLLERAVRWVTIMIVIVFDPLAIILILAANNSLRWEREDKQKPLIPQAPISEPAEKTETTHEASHETDGYHEPQQSAYKQGSYNVNYSFSGTTIKLNPETQETDLPETPVVTPDNHETPWPTEWREPEALVTQEQPESNTVSTPEDTILETTGVTQEAEIFHPNQVYVTYNGKNISVDALKGIRPDLVLPANAPENEILFGTSFPSIARTGDIYIRVDQQPNRVFKFNGVKWVELDRTQNTTYLQNTAYIQYLISKVHTGEVDVESLTDAEQEEIKTYLSTSN